jgi:DNA repair protein RadC
MGEYQPRIKELPLSDQPRERLVVVGPAALSDVDTIETG